MQWSQWDIFLTQVFLPPAHFLLTWPETTLVNELCNLLKGSHIMWKKLKTLSRPAGRILNTQSWQLRVWQTPHVLGCTVCSPSWHPPGCLTPSPEVTESMPTVWHMSIAMVCSPALLCPQGWWSSFQSTVTPAMPCASYTNLLHAQDLHFPKGTYNFVQLTEGIPSLTCRGVVSDKTEAEFLRHA